MFSIYCFAQNNDTNTIVIKSDTTFTTKIINGKSKVVREVTIYDTLYILKNMKFRSAKIMLNDNKPQFRTKLHNLYSLRVNDISSEFGIGFSYSNSFVTSDLQEDVYNVDVSNTNNYSIDGFFNFNINKYNVSTGIGVKYTTQNINIKYNELNVDTTFTWMFNQHDTSFLDTIKLLDISQLPDSVYIIKVVNRDSVIIDSVKNYKFDTINENRTFAHCNRYYYVEFPLIFGYSFHYKKSLFTVQVGSVFSWLAKSYVYSIVESNGITYLSTKDFNKFALDGYFGFGIKYEFSNLNGLCFSPYVRFPIIEDFGNDRFIGNKTTKFGIRINYIFSLF